LESCQNGVGRLPAQLLVGDGLDERLKGRQPARAEPQRAYAPDDFGHDRIGLG